ncbi:MAG: hypothetical protein IK040_00785, partial [Spirochaetia bacterium]|nr:hypothetical protein [Spirochaetia bacterium]
MKKNPARWQGNKKGLPFEVQPYGLSIQSTDNTHVSVIGLVAVVRITTVEEYAPRGETGTR